MNVLVITNLFPNARQPNRGVFNFQQIKALSELCSLKVIAPLPLFGFSRQEVPLRETIDGIDVYHPRYLVTPKVGRCLYGFYFYLGIRGLVRRLEKEFGFQVIYSTWAYPDSFAAARLAREMSKNIVIKVHGSDIDLFTRSFLRRKMIAGALKNAYQVIAVSQSLKKKILGLRVLENKVALIPNGVDRRKFRPLDRDEARKALGLAPEKKWIGYLGNLVKDKGVQDLIRAAAELDPDTALAVIGQGAYRSVLESLTEGLGLTERVRFVGAVAHNQVPLWMNAVDVFCLPSHHEGCPNVVVEALSCGVPVVATRVGGIPDMVGPRDGELVEPQDPPALAKALSRSLGRELQSRPARARNFRSWEETAREILFILSSAVINPGED